MIHPRRIDGKPLRVLSLPDGRVYVDILDTRDTFGKLVHRGGPEYPNHFCRFKGYGLADNLVRCYKCGRVMPKENEEV